MSDSYRERADMTEDEAIIRARNEFDGKGRVEVGSLAQGARYAVNMSFEELFNQQEAEAEEFSGFVALNKPNGENMGKYHRFNYHTATESHEEIEGIEGALVGYFMDDKEELTQYADPQSLKILDDHEERFVRQPNQ